MLVDVIWNYETIDMYSFQVEQSAGQYFQGKG